MTVAKAHLLTALAFTTLAGCASTTLNPMTLSETGAAYAVTNVCLPFLKGEGSIEQLVGVDGREVDNANKTKRIQALWGRGNVTIEESERGGGCYIRANRGDGRQLRTAVLQAMNDAGAPTTPIMDSAGGVDSPDNPFRQEQHCFQLNGQPAAMLLSTSPSGARVPLQMTIFGDDDSGRCVASTATAPPTST